MTDALPFLLAAALVLAILVRPALRAIRRPSPGGSLMVTSLSFLLGAAILAFREPTEAHVQVLAIVCGMIPCYLAGFYGFGRLFRLRLEVAAHEEPRVATDTPTRWHWGAFLGLLAAMLFILFVTGTDRILAALYQFVFVGDTSINVMELRLNFSTGEERYLAPGYVKQVRDILLPLAALVLVYAASRRKGVFLGMLALVVPLVAALMISSGERGFMMLFLLGTVAAGFQALRMKAVTRRTLALPLVFIALVGGGLFSALNSTYVTRSYEDTSMGVILADRIVTTVPAENALGYHVWRKGAPSPGAGWISELSTILPGKKIVLSTLLHEEMGGGEKGNSVLGTWTDVYYNFGWALGLPVSVGVGCFFALFTHWVNTRSLRSPEGRLCATWMSIAMLNVYSPFGFMLYGPFILSAVLVLVTRRTRRRATVRSPKALGVAPA